MATFSINRILYRNKLMKYYRRQYMFPCEKYFSSQDTTDENNPKHGSNEKDQKKNEEKQTKQSLKEMSPEGQTKEAAKKKLFSLLSELKVSSEIPKVKPDLVLSKPLRRPTKKERFQHLIKKQRSPEEEMKLAVQAVAESVGGDVEKTQEEIQEKLVSLHLSPPSETSGVSEKYESGDMGIDEKVQENIMSSVKDIASTVPAPIKSKLTQRLLRLSVENKGEAQPKLSFEDTMKGMKFEKRKEANEQSRRRVRERKRAPREFNERDKEQEETNIVARKVAERPKVTSQINIFQSAPLDIFTLDADTKVETVNTVWQKLEEKRLKLLIEFAPANAFEEMMMWTEQGKHWKFPIDNEIDIGAEEKVGFNEHVFLERHLHGFPTKGPIRYFMELVTVGLSKNPYITVERKIENIDWFRQYFKEKEDILKEYGALE